MHEKSSGEVSRRAWLRGAVTMSVLAVVAGGSLSTSTGATASVTPAPAPEDLATTHPVSPQQYVATMPAADERAGAWTSIDGVRAEYRDAVAIFPHPLPEGYSFPAESSVRDPKDEYKVEYSAGSGGVEAYLFWQNATATAAYAAYLRGNKKQTSTHLRAIEASYNSPVRALYINDPELAYVRHAIIPAQQGDFTGLRQLSIEPFLNVPISRAIASSAGDAF